MEKVIDAAKISIQAIIIMIIINVRILVGTLLVIIIGIMISYVIIVVAIAVAFVIIILVLMGVPAIHVDYKKCKVVVITLMNNSTVTKRIIKSLNVKSRYKAVKISQR